MAWEFPDDRYPDRVVSEGDVPPLSEARPWSEHDEEPTDYRGSEERMSLAVAIAMKLVTGLLVIGSGS